MIAVDTNILLYSHRADSPWFASALAAIRSLAQSRSAWAIPWPCIHEFLAVVTHPRIFLPPTPIDRACDQVDAWMESPSLVLLAEDGAYWPELRSLVIRGRAAGARVHDARIAALCRRHGVTELWTADRDFGRFPNLVSRNPLTT